MPKVDGWTFIATRNGEIPPHLQMQQRIDASRQEREFRARAVLQTLVYERYELGREQYQGYVPPSSPDAPPSGKNSPHDEPPKRTPEYIKQTAEFYQQESALCSNVHLKRAYKVLADYMLLLDAPEHENLRSMISINHDNHCLEQRIATQEIVMFAAGAVELLQQKQTASRALDMLVVTHMANMLNKNGMYGQARDFINQFALSAHLADNPAWTEDPLRRSLNEQSLHMLSALSLLSFCEGHIPHFLLNCSVITLRSMDMLRNPDVPLRGDRGPLHVIHNLATMAGHLAQLALPMAKKSIGLAAIALRLNDSMTNQFADGAILGALQAGSEFDLGHSVGSIAEATAAGVSFLADFFHELDIDHRLWLQKYNYAEKVTAMCNAIEKATPEQIGHAMGYAGTDFVLCQPAFGLLGQSLSLCAAGVRQAVAPGTKIHKILEKSKKALNFTKPELEFIAQEAYGLETLIFTEAAEELSAKLSPLGKRQPARLGGTAPKSAVHLAKLQTFELGLEDLVKKYGEKIMQDAQQALNINEYKIIHTQVSETLIELENEAQKIKKVKSKPHRNNFMNDMGHSGNVTRTSVEEGLTACVAEDQGFFKQLTRAVEREIDFVDETGRRWDIKDAASKRAKNANYKFELEEFVQLVADSLEKGENVMVDITQLNEVDLFNLTERLNKLSLTITNDLQILYIHRSNYLASIFIKR